MDIYKEKLPAGVSYALKPSALVTALQMGGVKTGAVLYQWRNGWVKGGVLFRADFYPAGRYYRNQDELLTVTSRAVPSSLRPQARTFVEGSVLPDFVEWITGLERLPPESTLRREKQSFVRAWQPDEDAPA
jgi:hypothetical protein